MPCSRDRKYEPLAPLADEITHRYAQGKPDAAVARVLVAAPSYESRIAAPHHRRRSPLSRLDDDRHSRSNSLQYRCNDYASVRQDGLSG